MTYDAIVAGLGGMGSAAVAHLAARGARVLGIEQFARGHALGSSAERSRIIRQAYFEHPAYVPLLLRAYTLWRELEARSGAEVLRLVGLLMVGHAESEVIAGSAHAARLYDLPVEPLDAPAVRARYPQLRIRDDEVALFEREGGALVPEAAIAAHLAWAEDAGAELRFETGLRSIEPDADAVAVTFADGTRARARRLVLALGAWFAGRDVALPVTAQRNVQLWFGPASDAYAAGRFPAFLIDRRGLPAPLYGFPDFGDGVKAAFHGFGAATAPDALDRAIDDARDVAPLAAALEAWMPGAAAGGLLSGKVCMYERTPDEHFVLDRDPCDPRIVLCGGGSGHGFKFASVVGEIAAQLALDDGTPFDLAFLSAQRFAATRSPETRP